MAKRIRETFNLPESDVKSLPMGSQGCDVWLSEAASSNFPYGIECKNTEKLNVWKAFDQALDNCPIDHMPLVVHTKNRGDVLAIMRFEDLLQLQQIVNSYWEKISVEP